MKTYQVDKNGYYGEFGGAYVPEILHQCVENLQNTYLQVLESDSFKEEFDQLLRDYVGRPSPLYLAKRLSEKYGCKIYLKREDLNHTGAHKINNTIGQILLLHSHFPLPKNREHVKDINLGKELFTLTQDFIVLYPQLIQPYESLLLFYTLLFFIIVNFC